MNLEKCHRWPPFHPYKVHIIVLITRQLCFVIDTGGLKNLQPINPIFYTRRAILATMYVYLISKSNDKAEIENIKSIDDTLNLKIVPL